MAACRLAAAFEHIEEADQIGVDVGVRIDQRIANAGLGGEMHDVGKPVRREQRGHRVAVCEIGLLEAKLRERRKLREPRLLQSRIVVGVEVVEADNTAPLLQQPLARHGSR